MNDLTTFLNDLESHNKTSLSQCAETFSRVHANDGLIYSAGSGHSLAMVMETFFRAGGLALVRPVMTMDLLPLDGALRSTLLERDPGLGETVLSTYPITGDDAVVIFSNSGRNPYPVEIGQAAKKTGASVIAFTSVSASNSAQPRASARLHEVADIVIDTMTPPGDVSHPKGEPITSPLSTIACATLWSCVLARTVSLDPTFPLWRSANSDGNDSYNATLIEKLKDRIPELYGTHSELST